MNRQLAQRAPPQRKTRRDGGADEAFAFTASAGGGQKELKRQREKDDEEVGEGAGVCGGVGSRNNSAKWSGNRQNRARGKEARMRGGR